MPYYDKCQAIRKLMLLTPGGLSGKEISQRLQVDQGQVTRYMSLFKCVPEVQEAARLGQIDGSSVYAISKADSNEEQLELLNAKLGGASRDEIEKKRGRKPEEPETPKDVF